MAHRTIRRFVMSSLAATLVFAAGTTAQAQAMPCGTHEGVVSRLTERFQEKQQAFGMVGNKAVVELFVSGKGSWTIIVTGTDGKACVIAAGESWESVPQMAGSDV